MKRRKNRGSQAWLLGHCVTGASLLVWGGPARAAETNSVLTASQVFEGGTNAYNNWIEFSTGGFLTRGNAAQAAENQRLRGGAFGGIQDFHLQQNVATNTTLTMDGRALFDERDYKLTLDLRREEVGYLRFNYENSRTWYNGAGGYYGGAGGIQYALPNDALAVDRGEVSFEAGLIKKDVPKITFKYTYRFRDGEKSSTIDGVVHPDGNARGLAPSFYDLDEKVHTVQLDATHRIKATELGVGLRYERGDLDNALKMTPGQGEAFQQQITDRQGTSYDLLSVHAFTETWIKKNLFFSTGFLFANLDNSFSGSRVYGNSFDVDPGSRLLNGGLGYYGLNGGSHQQEYVLNLNLMANLFTNFSIVPSLRAQKEDMNADSSGMGTQLNAMGPFDSLSDRQTLDVTERLDWRYTGVTNWVFYGGGEWTQGQGNLRETNGLSQVNGIGVPPILRETDNSRLFQKYSIGARWYPLRRVTVDAGGYYKYNRYDYWADRDEYGHPLDSTANGAASGNRYPAYLVMQGFETYDGSLRLTLRPVQNVTLISRYEYQLSTVQTKPDPSSQLDRVESSQMTSHIIAQNVSWTPWSRLSLQAGFNYVLSNTRNSMSDYTAAVLNAQNNYWTLNFNAGLVLDAKTDLNIGYFYYRADDYQDNSTFGVPYGAGAEEHGVTATITRRLSPRLRLNLKYGYYHYTDALYGGNNNYEAHLVYSSLQYRF